MRATSSPDKLVKINQAMSPSTTTWFGPLRQPKGRKGVFLHCCLRWALQRPLFRSCKGREQEGKEQRGLGMQQDNASSYAGHF